MSIHAFLLLLPIVLAACTSGGNPQSAAQAGDDLPFDVIVEETYSTFENAVQEVVQDASAWAAAWERLRGTVEPAPPQPEVDFEVDVVVVAALGSKSTGGYAIAVERVRRSETGLVVHVVETSPGPGCMVMQALTSPATAIRIPRPGVPITFEVRNETTAC